MGAPDGRAILEQVLATDAYLQGTEPHEAAQAGLPRARRTPTLMRRMVVDRDTLRTPAGPADG
jgi:hypothetical protein